MRTARLDREMERDVVDLPQTPGTHRCLHASSGAHFTVHLPQAAASADTLPLVLGLHWGGPTYPFISHDFLQGFVLPALEGLEAILLALDLDAESWTDPAGLRQVLDLLDRLQLNPLLPARRPVVLGYSLGGMGSWELGLQHADRFSGLIAVSSPPPQAAPSAEWPLPAYVIHGKSDELFPFDNTSAFVTQAQAKGAPIEFVAVGGATHFATQAYVEPLRGAIPWITEAFESE